MRQLRAALILLALLAVPVGATGACPQPQARQFDFWLGQWDIHQKILQADGTWRAFEAHNSVSTALGGCALLERWHGTVLLPWRGMEEPAAMEGMSVRAYDPRDERWRIYWMSSLAPRFDQPFEGTFKDGRGEFLSTHEGPAGERRTRITFSDITENSVHWELAVSADQGKTWSPIWIMDMVRHRPDSDSE